MSRMHLATRSIVALGAALVIAGCGGGGDDAMVDPGASATPAPDPGAATVGDPNAAPAVDPATGLPVDPAAGAIDPATGLPIDPAAGGDIGSMDISETIPTLEGHKVKGGLAAVGSTPLFAPGAVKSDELDQMTGDTKGGGGEVGPKLDDPAIDAPQDAAPKVTFSGARVFVDGVSHEVSLNGTFPKGDPVFRLVSVTGKSIEIELVAGEFTTSGGTGVFLDKGETVSVFNQSEQLNYRVKYLRPVTSTSDIGFN